MRFILAALAIVFLVTAFLTDSPGLLGLSLVGAFVFAFMAVFAFAQARIEANQARQNYVPSAQEREVMRLAAEKRKRAGTAAASGAYAGRDHDGDGD